MRSTDFLFGNRTEVDTADRSIGQDFGKEAAPFENRRTGVPVKATHWSGCNRLRADTCLTIGRVRVESQAHQLEVLFARRSLQLLEQVQLVQFHIHEVPLRLVHTCHQRRLCHIRVDNLNHQAFGTHQLVLVGTTLLTVLLPLSLATLILLVPTFYIGHDMLYRLVYTTLTGTRSCHQAVHQRRLVFHIVRVTKTYFFQVSGQWWKYGVSHSCLIDFRCLRDEQLNQLRLLFRHFGRCGGSGCQMLDV